MKDFFFNVRFGSRQISILLSTIAVVNVVLLINTAALSFVAIDWKRLNIRSFVMGQLNLTGENVIAVWYSSMLLLLAAVLCLFCFAVDKKNLKRDYERPLRYGWLALGAAFAMLSLDELGSFHETIGDSRLFNLLSAGWNVFYLLIGLGGMFMAAFAWLRIRRVPLAFYSMIVGVLFYLSNPVQEHYEISTMRLSADPANWRRPPLFIVLEEGSEIFGSFFFILALVGFLAAADNGKGIFQPALSVTFGFRRKLLLVFFCILFLSSASVFYLIDNFARPPEKYDGIAQNWFPAAAAFLSSVCALLMSRADDVGPGKKRRVFLFLSLFSLLISVYAGGNFYNRDPEGVLRIFELAVNGLIVAGAVSAAGLTARVCRRRIGRIGAAGWAMLIVIAFVPGIGLFPELVYLAFLLLFVALAAQFRHQRPEPVLIDLIGDG